MSSAKEQYTLSLDSPSSDLSTTGGKGHNLAILSRDGNFPVPPGFVVTVAAYHEFIKESGLLNDINKALTKLKNKDDGQSDASTAELEKISDIIRNAFRNCSVSKALRAEITNRLADLFPDPNVYLAVRSSATCEDMPDASFAGQHDTYLNVNPTADNVCKHVVDCFSSLFTSRAISYRERNALSHIDAGMAVVVQAMVQSNTSGVLFTANPLTGRRTESVLEAIPGLGEALVSGLTEPDRYVASRSKDDTIDIKDKRVGAKAKAIRSVEGGGVKEEISEPAISSGGDEKESSTVLTDDEVKDLIKLGQEVESLFQSNAQDIEWARSSEGKTYVVQSRPMTTLFPLPGVPEGVPLQVYFSFNAVQGIAGPLYPAGQDVIRGILGGLVEFVSWGKFGKQGLFLNAVAERLYGNVSNVLRNSIGRKIIRNALKAVEPGILAGVNEVLEEPGMEVTTGMNPVLFLRFLSVAAVVFPRYMLSFMFPDRARERLVRMVNKKVASTEKAAQKVDNMLDAVSFKQTTFRAFFPSIFLHFIPRMATAMSPLVLLTKLASSIPDGKDLVLTITRGLPHNVTTEMDLKLWQVAKAIQSDEKSLEHFHRNDADTLADECIGGRLPGSAQDAVGQFMDEYGMRGLCEIDFGRPRWREEPAPLMQTLKSYIDIDEEHAPDKVFAAGEVAAEEAIERLGQELGKPWLVSFLARRVRAIAGVRELPKFTIIRTMGIVREKMIWEGEKLVEEGVIDNAKDVFVLHDDDLLALARGELKDPKLLIAERKAVMDRESERTRVPRVITSDGFAFYGGAVSRATVSEGANVLCGEPVSPGTYEGRIRVVQDPSKTKLAPGEVLCCHGTDPSWTPLFLSAGALVMEVGGLLTHGSVVAREYGIPAVVGLERVTEKLTTGQLVRVDGSSGVVEILEEAEK